MTPKRNTAVSVKEWTKTFTRCLEEEELFDDEDAATLRHLIIRLVWTDPTVAFDSGRWINQELILATDTNAWVAVHQMFGCPWKNRNKWFPDNQDEKNPKPKKNITNYFSPKDKTITNEKEKDTKKEKQISAMPIDDEVSKGKEDKDATPLKELKESKEKTIN